MFLDNANGIQVVDLEESFRMRCSKVIFVMQVSSYGCFRLGKGSLKGAWGSLGGPLRSLGGPWGSWGSQGLPEAPHGRPQGGHMSRLDGKICAL